MSNSSAQDSFSITLDDTITIDTSSWGNYTAGGAGGSSMNTITLTGAAGSVYTIGSGGAGDIGTTFNWKMPEEFIDSFPDWDRVQQMCEQYPGLEIALRNFQTIYTLVKDDYDNPKDKK